MHSSCGLMQACACRYEDWMKMFLRSCGPRCARVHLLPVFDLTQVCHESPYRLPAVAAVHHLQAAPWQQLNISLGSPLRSALCLCHKHRSSSAAFRTCQ